MQIGDTVFVGYPSVVHYNTQGAPGATRGETPINHLLWGDYAKVRTVDGDWINIRTRGRNGWVRRDQLQLNRILEVNFVDIGQGDGCHIQTPEDRALVFDAGEGDNMFRFLRWRFGKFERPFTFEAFLCSHPDKDHYFGFKPLLEHDNVHVGTIYHNTIVEQMADGKKSLGAEAKAAGRNYLTGLVHTLADLRAITGDEARRGGRLYPNLLRTGIDSGRVGDVAGLTASMDWQVPRYVPGYGPGDARGMTLKILGPVPETFGPGQTGLRRIGRKSETKNGHSVALILEVGNVRMLLGGDLNKKSQEYLMAHYTGLDPRPSTPTEHELLVAEGRKHFEVDIAKACHHGSAHVLPSFLAATNPLVTIISSGDDEPHSHPRPDTLGLVGKFSRSDRPLIFSTELSRSGSEHIKHPNLVRRELRARIDKEAAVLNDPAASDAQKADASRRLDDHLKIIERSVANYGMINVRTDGDRVIIAQRLERERSKRQRWDVYQFESDDRGRLQYIH